jgi:hypothetical protein
MANNWMDSRDYNVFIQELVATMLGNITIREYVYYYTFDVKCCQSEKIDK